MRISEIIRRANGEKPDFAIDDIGDIGHWQGMNDAALIAETEELVQLNENQQVVLELLQKAYAKNKWMTPFGAVFSVANENDFAIRAWLTKEEQFKVLAAFADWEMKEVAE